MTDYPKKFIGSRLIKQWIDSTLHSAFLLGLMTTPATAATLDLEVIGSYSTGLFDQESAFISAFDPFTNNLFVTNRAQNSLDILNLNDPTNPFLADQMNLSDLGSDLFGNVLHVRSYTYDTETLFALSVENINPQENGFVIFLDGDGNLFNSSLETSSVTVGALPDMLTFTADGLKILTANEGEANDEYTVDPEGSISIIDLDNLFGDLAPSVTTVGFTDFNVGGYKHHQLDPEVRIFGPNATVAQDLEPEYITISPDDPKKAFVTLQENNAIAVLDLETEEFTAIWSAGFQDYSLAGNGLDASDKDDEINITTYPNLFGVRGLDEAFAYTVGDQTYIVAAAEGSSRDSDGFNEEVRVKDLVLDPVAFPNAEELQQNENLGRLQVTTTRGDTDGDGDFDELYAFGGRGFVIYDEHGNIVFESGDQFEQMTAELYPEFFNSDNSENNFDNRSDNKGPEPEGVTVGVIDGRTYAFIGLERIGGVAVYDITDPHNASFENYINNRDFSVEFDVDHEGDPAPTPQQLAAVGDLGPEGLLWINSENSPNGKALLVATNEVSGTTTLYSVKQVPEPGMVLGLIGVSTLGRLLLKRRGSHNSD